jgi:hypothetical protein
MVTFIEPGTIMPAAEKYSGLPIRDRHVTVLPSLVVTVTSTGLDSSPDSASLDGIATDDTPLHNMYSVPLTAAALQNACASSQAPYKLQIYGVLQ